MKHIILFVLSIFLVTSTLFAQEDKAVILLRLKYKSPAEVGVGGKLKIRNINTNETFESHAKIGLNPHVKISNVPFGTYIVEELEIRTGAGRIFIQEDLFFNQIKIEEPKVYYLGNYMTKKIPPLLKYNVQIFKQDKENNNKIYDEVKENFTNLQNVKVIYDIELLKKDSTIIQLR